METSIKTQFIKDLANKVLERNRRGNRQETGQGNRGNFRAENKVEKFPKAEARIRAWLDHIRETDPELFADVIDRCRTNPDAMEYFLSRAKEAVL